MIYSKIICCLTILFSVFIQHSVEAQKIEKIISLPNQAAPRDLIYNSINNKIYSANTPDLNNPGAATESVTIIDGTTNEVITSIPMKKGSRDFCHNTKDNKIYVANYFADSISIIDGKTDVVTAIIPAGDGPRALVYNSKNNRVYCVNELSGNVTVIDGSTNAVLTTVTVGSKPRVICYNPTNNKVYIPNAGSGNLSVISGETNAVMATLTMGNVPRGITYNPQNNKIYVSNYGSDNVSVVDGAADVVVTTISVGDGPTAIFHNPDGNKIYCSNVGAPGPNTPEECSVSIIDASANTVVKTLKTGDEPTAFCYASRSKRIYWANEWSHDIAVVDAVTDTFITTIKFDNPPVTPVDVCYNPLNNRIYSANRLKLSLAVIKDSVNVNTTATVKAWNADGQVFVVWKTNTPAPLTYNIYMSTKPVSSVTDAIKIGSVFEPEWKGKRLTLAKADARWTIPDGSGGSYQLAANEGLFVYTPHDTATVYFYINQNNDTQLSETNRSEQRLFVRYNPETEPVKCHAQFSGETPQGFPYTVFALWVDGRDNPDDARPDIPVMANSAKNGAPHVFAVYQPQNGLPAGPGPAVVCLHGGGQEGSYWAYAPNAGHYRNTGNVPVDGVTIAFDDRLFLAANGMVNEDRPSNWFGWHTGLNAVNAANPPANAVVVPYTLRRLMWTIDWLIHSSTFNIDAKKVAVMGNSMGGTGALLLSRWKPERFSAASAFVPPHYTPETGARLFGNTQTNLKTTETGPNGITLRVNDFFDPAVRVSPISRDYCLTRIYRGRCDEAAEWGPQHIQLYNDLNNKGLGVHLYWDNRDHTASDWTTDDPQTSCADIGQWVSPARTQKCAVNYQSRFRSDRSYPGFFNDDQNLIVAGRQPTLGNGNATDGTPWGTWAGYYEWDVNTVTDTSTQWACTLYLTGQSPTSVDNYPADSARCDVTVLKATQFTPVSGTNLKWRLIRISDNKLLQSGVIQPDQTGKVTISGITLFKNPVRSRLIIEFQDVDQDGDSYAGPDDCNDANPNIYPGAAELCDGIDNNCNGLIDDGVQQATYFRDEDNDGYGNPDSMRIFCLPLDSIPAEYVITPGDCDDKNALIYPGATEICDGNDNNCNDTIDEELLSFTYFRDTDGDGYGNATQKLDTCLTAAPPAFVANDLDCDDNDAAVNPGASEVCDGKDNDCNGRNDDGLALLTYFTDADGDGYGNAAQKLDTCLIVAPPAFVANDLDCDDSNAAVNPAQPELPGDGLDNDCDGIIDNTSTTNDVKTDFSVYPNPVRDWLNIQTSMKQEIGYEILNTEGRKIRSGMVNAIGGLIRISFISDLPGVYILQLRESNEIKIQKIRVVKI